ncbi:hypothetical protein [Sphingobium yanoikuyae]|uniref:hypothetical protein n=1 Tax=Sphingobium yanoikuyae TaxID=13690 RepID=UPI0022DD89F1|nr:hypothetical protein [Sphingobium yanoikuyae]WBQ19078.1 hypothetical protein PAE53_24920 [Sphingobium yanoikuyae]
MIDEGDRGDRCLVHDPVQGLSMGGASRTVTLRLSRGSRRRVNILRVARVTVQRCALEGGMFATLQSAD